MRLINIELSCLCGLNSMLPNANIGFQLPVACPQTRTVLNSRGPGFAQLGIFIRLHLQGSPV
jgi:hypothetical protein